MSRCQPDRNTDVLCDRASHRRVSGPEPLLTGPAASPTPNRAFIAARKEKGYGRNALAARVREWGRADDPDRDPPSLDSVVKCIGRVERGEVRSPGDFYAPAFAAVLGVPAAELFGTDQPFAVAGTGGGAAVTAHQFVPVFVGAESVRRLATNHRYKPVNLDWAAGWTCEVDHPDGTARAYLMEWGVAVVHLSRQLAMPSVAALATWRKRSHTEVLGENALDGHFAQVVGEDIVGSPEYVLTTFWVDEPMWDQRDLGPAAHLMCVPSVLLDRSLDDEDDLLARAEVAERAHLRSGFTHREVVEFGVPGVAVGCASWSGVVYIPLAPSRALQPDELVSFEVIVQGLWCYSAHVLAAADGVERAIPARYGWRFLRSCRSRLTTPTPTETGQVRMMRDAVLTTSRLIERLDQAQAILRDPD
jgi:hypothetical protein